MDLWIRDLDDETIRELEEQAAENNRTLEEELKAILNERAERSARTRVNGARKAR
jgi:plasmid stability protein